MGMKNAFEIYFKKQRDYWQAKYSSFPQMPYNKAINGRMIIPNTIKEGYVQWQPVLQDRSVDFFLLEKELNLFIHPHIKEYFTSYWFLSLVGLFGNNKLRFTIIPCGIDILELAEESIKWGMKNFPEKKNQFELGFATVDGDDSFLIYVDNKTTYVNLVQLEDGIEISLGVLEKVISEMEVNR